MAETDAPSGKLQSLKRLVPAKLKRRVKRVVLERTFERAVQQITGLSPGQVPTREMLIGLQEGWTNRGFVAKYDYLEEVARRAATTSGPILECGSGLTTVLLGLLAGRRGVETWSLEHIPLWHERVTERLRRYRIPGVHLCLSNLREYSGFSWYDPQKDTLPDEFQLVICDGPPELTPGGRYGLLPVLGECLPVGSLILLDDANRASETEILRRWATEAEMSIALREEPTGTFALVSRR